MHADARTRGREYACIFAVQIELPSRMRWALIAFQKCDGHTYKHTAAYPWPTVCDPMPGANALGNKFVIHHLCYQYGSVVWLRFQLIHKKLELSRAHTPHAYTRAIASIILVTFVCKAQFIDDPYWCWVWACVVEAAHGITGCDQKAWLIETRDL